MGMVENRSVIGDFFVSFYLNGDKSLVLANGIPSYITKHHPLVKFCEENKVNLFLPRYYGSFEANGKFSIKSCIKTIEKAMHFARSEKAIEIFNNKEISWNAGKIYLIGFSFGALPTLLSSVSEKNTEIILICPFVNASINTNNKCGAEEEICYVEKAYPNLYRFKANILIKECKSVIYPKKRDFTLVIGNKDSSISKEEIEFLKEKYQPKIIEFEGGHTIPLNVLKELVT